MTEKVDHAAEAVRLLGDAERAMIPNASGLTNSDIAMARREHAQAHALLAIVEELRGLRKDLNREDARRQPYRPAGPSPYDASVKR